MYAIVEIAGQQFKVEKKQELFVHRLEEKEGSKIEFSDVLLIDKDGKVDIGTPTIKGAVISAKVLEHMKGDKVLVFKKKRRKGYQKLNGHRQYLSRIVINDILENVPVSAAPKAKKEDKKESAPKATVKADPKPKAAKPEAKKAVKKAAPKKVTTAKKTTAKPATAAKKAAPKAEKPAAKAVTKKAAPKKAAKPKAAPKAKKADKPASGKTAADKEKKEDK